jgi:glycerate kinase
MAQALGVRLLDGENRDLPPGGAALVRLRNIDVSGLDRRIASCRVRAACDVTNPLCGPQGASHIYGPQKGATDDVCRQLDKALDNYATVLERDLGIDVRHTPGVGASGGLGAGLVAFLGAELARGMDIVAGAVTGEGRLDAQTAFGKTVSGVAERAKASGVPVVALAGELAGDLSALYERGLTSAMSIAPGPVTAADSMDSAAALVTDAAERVVRLFIAGHDMSRRIDRPSEPP